MKIKEQPCSLELQKAGIIHSDGEGFSNNDWMWNMCLTNRETKAVTIFASGTLAECIDRSLERVEFMRKGLQAMKDGHEKQAKDNEPK